MPKTFNDPVTIRFTCVECGSVIPVTVERADLERWNNREAHIQDCFPYLSPGKRELFLSGICNSCYNKMFNFDE